MNPILTRHVCLIICVTATILWVSPVFATTIYIPEVKGKIGQSVEIPIMIDRVDNLAGVKLVMEYDCKILIFKNGSKTKESNSLMHIINDKNPGKLIVVMAGAKGIKGENFPILILTFKTKGNLTGNQTKSIKIKDVNLMSDQLKEITCDVAVRPLTVSH